MLYTDRWDSLIKWWATALKFEQITGFSWLLIKAQVYQESCMNPLAVSECNAKGLMQLLDGTARDMGVKDNSIFDPDTNLRAGISYLLDQWKHFPEIPDPVERMKFALAAYNAGRGNINKAKADDITLWALAAQVLPTITSVVNAKQTTDYVLRIMVKYSEYKSSSGAMT